MLAYLLGFAATLWPIVYPNLAGVSLATLGLLFWRFSPAGKSLGLVVLIVALLSQVVFDYGVWKGESYVQARSKAVMERSVALGKKARSDAEKSIAAKPPVPRAAPSGVRNRGARLDKFDRG